MSDCAACAGKCELVLPGLLSEQAWDLRLPRHRTRVNVTKPRVSRVLWVWVGASPSACGALRSHNFAPLCAMSSLTPWSVHPICTHVLQNPPFPELPAGSKARGWGCTAPHRQPRSCPLITRRDRLPVTWEEVVCGMVAVTSRFRNVAMA